MSTGKYSPLCPHANEPGWDVYKFNSYGEIPVEFDSSAYDPKTMFDNYDDEGFDSYGYSAFDIDGNYVGHGNGIDRYGYTEMDYLMDAAAGGNIYDDLQGWGGETLETFLRNR